MALSNHPHKLATSPQAGLVVHRDSLSIRAAALPKMLRKIKPNIRIKVFVGVCMLFKNIGMKLRISQPIRHTFFPKNVT
jgi:hypothetical protein